MYRCPSSPHKNRAFLTAISQLAYANPFLPEWVEFERAVLGDAFVAGELAPDGRF
jgi:hypothetical protein